MTIEQNLKTYIDDHAVSISALSEKSGVSTIRLRRILNEGIKVKADELVSITNVLGIKVEDLCNE